MSFVRAASPTYFAPAVLQLLDGEGRLVANKFDCQFKRLKKSELLQLEAALQRWVDASASAAVAPAGKEGEAAAARLVTAKPQDAQGEENKDRWLLRRVMVGWRGVQAADGTELTFSIEAVDETEEECPGFYAACARSFFLSNQPREAAHLAAEKN